MKKTFKTLVVMLVCSLAFSGLTFAEDSKYSEAELNQILLDSGMPQDVLNSLDFNEKSLIVTESGEDLKYKGSSQSAYRVNATTGELELLSTDSRVSPYSISSADLTFGIQHFSVSINGVAMDEIYASFEWKNPPADSPTGIQKDSIAIAVPEGWEIQSGRYAGAIQRWETYANGSRWSSVTSSGVGNSGNPSGYSLYGASWDFSGDFASTWFSKYKGTVKLTMKKKSSSAVNRVVAKYIQAKNNTWGNYSVSVAWGPLSVTFTPKAGSNDDASVDLSWK